MAQPKPVAINHSGPAYQSEAGLDAQNSMVRSVVNAACRDASKAGWDTAIEAINLVLAAAEPDGPTAVSIDTILLAEAKIASALAEIDHVMQMTDQMLEFSPSPHSH